jgi:hypothetical protein
MPKVSDGAFNLGVSKQELHDSQIAGAPTAATSRSVLVTQAASAGVGYQ